LPKKKVIYNLYNKSKNCLIAAKALIADNFLLRFKGLMFRDSIGEEEALIFYQTPSIHTFFMRFPIEVVFLNQKLQVVKIYEELRPGKVVFSASSSIAIELPAHKTSKQTLEIGDILVLTESLF